MATIEERAKKHSQRIFPCNNEYTERRIAELAYFHGAKEQEEIDDAQLEGIASQWKQEEALWIERFEAIRNVLLEHQGELISPELISDILGDDIPYLRENNKATEE